MLTPPEMPKASSLLPFSFFVLMLMWAPPTSPELVALKTLLTSMLPIISEEKKPRAIFLCSGYSDGKGNPFRVVALYLFFQAEDGIRDLYVTGVQTCALPISRSDNDVYARYLVRLGEMRESAKIITQALEGMLEGPWHADAPHVILPDREKMKTQME